jgi:hypothetical protein
MSSIYQISAALPADNFAALTAGVALDPRPNALYIVTTGTLLLDNAAGVTTDFGTVPAGTTIQVRPVQIDATSTAVVVGLY